MQIIANPPSYRPLSHRVATELPRVLRGRPIINITALPVSRGETPGKREPDAVFPPGTGVDLPCR